MIERIIKNEERLDSLLLCINKLQNDLEIFKSNKKNLYLLNKYYGSRNWINDKEAYENNRIPKIKAGVLSEDSVWNLFEDLDDLMSDMKKIVTDYEKLK